MVWKPGSCSNFPIQDVVTTTVKDALVRTIVEADNPYLGEQLTYIQVRWVLNWLIENPTDFIDACIEAGTLREVESDALMVTAWCET